MVSSIRAEQSALLDICELIRCCSNFEFLVDASPLKFNASVRNNKKILKIKINSNQYITILTPYAALPECSMDS